MRREVARRALEQSAGRHHPQDAPVRGFELQPAHVRLVAVLLRHDVGHVLPTHGPRIPPHGRSPYAVAVALVRPTAEPAEPLELRREHERHPHSRQVGQRAVRLDEVLAHHDTLGTKPVGMAVAERARRRRARADLLDHQPQRAVPAHARLHPVRRQLDVLQPGREPAVERSATLVRDTLDPVVVGWCAPHLQLRSCEHDRLTLPREPLDPPRPW